MLSRSRWLVGSSNIIKLPPFNIAFAIIQRTFSPPESTLTSFSASSPENNILPSQPRIKLSVWSSLEYCLNQSINDNSLLKNSLFFKASNVQLFAEYEGFMSVFGLINDHINMVEDALKNPKNIKKELIEKKIVSGDYQFVFVNLSAKLEIILKNKFKLDGKLSDMLSEARRSGAIERNFATDLHDFRENRNAYIHPEDRTANFKADDLRRWSKEIFELEEEKK